VANKIRERERDFAKDDSRAFPLGLLFY